MFILVAKSDYTTYSSYKDKESTLESWLFEMDLAMGYKSANFGY